MSSKPSRPAPPPPKPGSVKVFRALYKYHAQQPDELSFEEGDLLYVFDMMSDPNWWKARCDRRSGLIPSNYVEENAEEVLHPLHESAKRGNLQFLEECLSNKVSVNSLDKAGCTALHWAAHGGHVECAQILLSITGVQVDVQNKLGDTPLHSSAWKGHSDIVRMLLVAGANKNVKNKEGRTPLELASDPETVALLKSSQRTSISTDPEEYLQSDEDSN
ncbi:osteoclast-stimulating factor 1-like [Dermacentor variabilis]|uniref:osteoclast-stimulating factor 1-like n=1 Tax=Dermacentor variabilis TaxID=34621 RepID=UPI003F5B8DC8